MSNSYFPSNDLAFEDWFTNFLNYLDENKERLGFTDAQVIALRVVETAFGNSVVQYQSLRDQAKAACADKEAKRAASEATMRPVVAQIQANPATTNMDREMLRIPMRGVITAPVVLDPSYDKPVPLIDINNRLTHSMRVRNQNGTTVSNARPSWAIGCEIWRTVGEPPVDPSEALYVDTLKSGRIVIEYPGSDAGKPVYYLLRWVGPRGEKGPWSETETATIAA